MGGNTKPDADFGLNRYGQGIGVGSGTVPTPTQSLLSKIKKIIIHIVELYRLVYANL